jgi:conjugative transfer signal peptidase TraF
MSRLAVLLVVTVSTLSVTAALAPPAKRLIYNTTASAPVGLYWRDDHPPQIGDLVVVRAPQALAHWMAVRRYLPLNVPLIKRLAARGGQDVCVRNGVVLIDRAPVARARTRDRLGRVLTPWSGCRQLRPDEVLLINSEPASLDSRYFGPLDRRAILGRVTPIWVREAR